MAEYNQLSQEQKTQYNEWLNKGTGNVGVSSIDAFVSLNNINHSTLQQERDGTSRDEDPFKRLS